MRHYENWIKAFSDFGAIGEAPLKFYFWTAVSTIAGALRRQVWIDQGHFQWVPNFYIILVAPPGIVNKTTTIDIGKNLLQQVKGVNFGPDVITWQALATSLAKCTEQVPFPDGSYMPMSALTLSSGEFGTFLNPQDREMIDVLVALWDGRRGYFHKVTKTQGEDKIENPWINIIACTTPAWISGNMPQYLIGGGFTSRCVFVYADQKRQFIAYPGLTVPPDFVETQTKLAEDLSAISLLRGNYRLTDAAIGWGNAWYEDHWGQKPKLGDIQFQGYWARKQTHLHKLAMIVAASQRDELIIDVPDLTLADGMLSGLEQDMSKVFASIGQSESAKAQNIIYETLLTMGGSTDKMELFTTAMFKIMSLPEFELACQSVIGAGLVIQMARGDRLVLQAKSRNAETHVAGGNA